MSGLGWYYPAGAENDPRAPYNQKDADDACLCGHSEADHYGAAGCLADVGNHFCACDEYRERGEPDADDLRDMRADA